MNGAVQMHSVATDLPPSSAGIERPADLRPLETLLARIQAKYRAEHVWLFGSRARGDAHPDSDWDVFVVVPDDTEEAELDPRVAWRLQRGSGVHADVIACRATDFRKAKDTVNTLAYVVAREGLLIQGRCTAAPRLFRMDLDVPGASHAQQQYP